MGGPKEPKKAEGNERAAPFVRAGRLRIPGTRRNAGEASGEMESGFSGEGEAELPGAGEPPARQLSLFARNDMTFVNQGIQAFRRLELERAVELFQRHRAVYPKGYDVSPRLSAAEFLAGGLREAPVDPCERAAALCRFWDAFEDRARSEGPAWMKFPGEIKKIYFSGVAEELLSISPADLSSLPGGIPPGFVLLQAERAEEAIASLQASIAETPHKAALYGWLGDAYLLRGGPAGGETVLPGSLPDRSRRD